MGDVINLRLARKARAAENRARHGQSSAERAAHRTEAERAARALEGRRRDDGEDHT